MTDDRLTSTRVAEILGVTASSVKRWADEGILPCERTAGGHRRFLASDVARFRASGSGDFDENLAALSPAELDSLGHGVIGLDDHGVILSYNRKESEFSGFSPEEAIGQNFFTELAPCCNNSLVYGAFREGIAANHLNVRIDYTFTYRVKPTNVVLQLSRDPQNKTNWLVVEHLA